MLNKQKMTRLVSLMITLMVIQGCVLTTCPTMPPAPTKPKLESLSKTTGGGITLNKEDATKLAVYILELEKGYK